MSSRASSKAVRAARSFGLLTSLATAAHATAPGGSNDDNLVSYEPPATERRGGFTIAMTNGFSLADFSGYPNRVTALGDPEQLESTGPVLGSSFSLWLGGALRDWIAVGGGIAATSALTGDYTAANAAFILHVEGYPLYALGGQFRNLGVSIEGGPAVTQMFAKSDTQMEDVLADGGSMSLLSTSVFWEPIRFWHFSMGPAFVMSHSFSQTLTMNQFALAFRTVFYGDQPKPPPRPNETAGFGSRTY